jgi:YidC/Oxa1 family membrane protein insertase
MLGDDDDNKRMAQKQLFMVMIMTVLMMLFFQYYMPQPSQRTPAPGTPGATAPVTTGQAISQQAPATAATAVADSTKWPYLPPIPEVVEAEVDPPVLENDYLRLVFTSIGGRLKEANIRFPSITAHPVQLIPQSPLPDTKAAYPFGLRFTEPAIGNALDFRRFEIADKSATSVTFALTIPNAFAIKKTFTLSGKPNLVNVKVEYQNLEPVVRILGLDDIPAYRLTWAPDVLSHDAYRGIEQTVVWRKDNENDFELTSAMEPEDSGAPYSRSIADAEWVATRSAYFFVAMKPEFEKGQAWATGVAKNFEFGAGVPRTEVAPQAVDAREFSAYIGPSRLDYLTQAWPTLSTAHRFFDTVDALDWFAKLLLRLLNAFYSVIPNYGICIILLTVVVRMVMFPLTLKQIRSMKRMQLLAPEMEELKKKYGENPQEMQAKMMELYRERNINPIGGCLPVFLQLPVFIALYRTFLSAFELYRAPFAGWIQDLSEPDRLYHFGWDITIPLIGSIEYLNILPLIGAVVMILSMKLTPQPQAMQDKTQKMILTFMPVFFSLMCYNFSSGINLYIITSTIIGILQSSVIRVTKVDAVSLDAKKKPAPGKKRMHWYDAAQAKKRLIAKEMKDASRRPAGKPGKPENTPSGSGANGSEGKAGKRQKDKKSATED